MLVLLPQLLLAAETLQIKEDKSSNVLKGIFYQVWGKLKSLNPSEAKNTKHRVIATAGIRGNETTESLLEPYWKGDHSEDQSFVASLKLYNQAQTAIEQGDLPHAEQALDALLQQHKQSALYPNALFAKGLVVGSQGKKAQSIELMRTLIKEHPSHALIDDANKVLQAQLG